MIPKLRAWDRQDERMSYGEVEYFDDTIKYRFDHFWTGADEDVEFMQSTGLKDKNGVEIFEGDIVNYVKSFTNPMTGSGSLSINKNLRIIFKDAEFTADGIDIRLKKVVSHMEVIGNIYENPELLEGHEK
ncbi:YopX family protein [Lactococcus lactis subsp. lactis]|uniref:YopX family protein n=1 Tax=Lactococcus lactis TaxID=1358 RepID=UPI002940B8F6|nr:YopX family protein [Lactococcus lactis]MDV4193061.1 YopX family protein [Lactococcus lactis subsp. lactis]